MGIAISGLGQGELDRTLARFYEVIASITEGSGFTNKQRDEAMALARRIKALGTPPDEEEFVTSLERLIDSFAAAAQNLQVDALAEIFHDVVTNNAGIIQTLVTSLGMRLLEVPQASPKIVSRFTQYEALAQNHDREDVAVPWHLVYSHRCGDAKQIDKEFDRMKAWQDAIRVQQVVETIERRSDPANIARAVTPKIQATALAHRDFLDKYMARLKELTE